jgi:hypothetical protein
MKIESMPNLSFVQRYLYLVKHHHSNTQSVASMLKPFIRTLVTHCTSHASKPSRRNCFRMVRYRSKSKPILSSGPHVAVVMISSVTIPS